MFKIILPLLLSLEIFASQSSDIANALKKASLQSGIDKRVLYTIAKIESEFEPHIIAFASQKKFNTAQTNIDIRNIPYKNEYLIQVRADKEMLKLIILELIKKGFSVDIGLMQINSSNLTKEELNHILELDYNLVKSTYILKLCIKQKNSLKESIECYNKGLRKVANYNYYEKFRKSFIRDFANIKE